VVLRKLESTKPGLLDPRRDLGRIDGENPRPRTRSGFLTLSRALLVAGALSLGVACVDLTPPESVQEYARGASGGSVSAPGTGGVIGVGGSSAVGAGGFSGVGGDMGLGGATGSPDANIEPDAPLGTGGLAGAGGGPGLDGPNGGGGAGGTTADVALGSGGSISGNGGTSADALADAGGLVGTGGKVGTGGAGTGGVVGTGGAGTGGAGSGGRVGTGGAGTGGAVGTGGSSAVLNCAAAIVPANSGTNGLVTNFSDWNATTKVWGSASNLNGTIFGYTDTANASTTMTGTATTAGLHLTGTVGTWAGGGLTFLECATVASFTQVRFTIANATASSCAVEFQLQTFDKRPMEQVPAGGCKADGGTCFGFPAKGAIVSLSSTFGATAVTSALSGFSGWSTANANQVVGVQWQFTGSSCPINVTISSVQFLP